MRPLDGLLARPIAHRGLHACGRPGPVENSLGAARAAIAGGFGVECDVQPSADGEAMVFHDDRLDRLTGARGRIDAWAAADLANLALSCDGGPIPTLAELLATIDGRVPLVIEVKAQALGSSALAARVHTLVAAYDGPVGVESFDPAVITCLRRLGARYPLGLVGPPETGTPVDAAVIAACDFVSWNIAHLATIAAAAPAVPRSSWTIRTREQEQTARRLGAQIVFEGLLPTA